MATLSFPTLARTAPTEMSEWALNSNTRKHQSPYTKTRRSLSIPGACWSFVAMWRNLGLPDRAILEAFVADLDGTAGRFYFSHPMYRVPRGTARGTGTCAAASQFATSLVLSGSGITSGTTLLRGDFVEVQVAGQSPMLVRVLADAVASSSITVSVKPMLRLAVPISTPFTLVSPRGQFELMDDKQSMEVRPGWRGKGIGDFTLDAIESF